MFILLKAWKDKLEGEILKVVVKTTEETFRLTQFLDKICSLCFSPPSLSQLFTATVVTSQVREGGEKEFAVGTSSPREREAS